MKKLCEYQEKYLDVETSTHIFNVTKIALIIGREMKLNEDSLLTLHEAAHFHDIGKIKIPPGIIDKCGPLTKEEYEIVKTHSKFGYDILIEFGATKEVAECVLYHHERCDGSGYPNGLVKDEIPVLSKIVAVADVFEALKNVRPYKKAWSEEKIYYYFVNDKTLCDQAKDILLSNFKELFLL